MARATVGRKKNAPRTFARSALAKLNYSLVFGFLVRFLLAVRAGFARIRLAGAGSRRVQRAWGARGGLAVLVRRARGASSARRFRCHAVMRVDLLTPGLAHFRPLRARERRRLIDLRFIDLRNKRYALTRTGAGTAERRCAASATRCIAGGAAGPRSRPGGRRAGATLRSTLRLQKLHRNRAQFVALRHDGKLDFAGLRIGDEIFDLAKLLAVLCFNLSIDDLLAHA